MTNHRLVIRWTGEGIKNMEELMEDVEILALPLESNVVGYEYDQCDENWEPVIQEGDFDND